MALTQIDDRGLKTPIDLLDNEKIRLGTGNDFAIYHSGSENRIEISNGNFFIDAVTQNEIMFTHDSKYMLRMSPDAGVRIYYDNSVKLETNTGGANVTGGLNVSGNLHCTADGGKIISGVGDDLQLFHDGTNSYVKNSTGALRVQGDLVQITDVAGGGGGDTMASFVSGGAANLYYDNSLKLATSSGGVNITGELTVTTDLVGIDNSKLKLGNSSDLQIFHDGSDSYIQHGGVGALSIESSSYVDIRHTSAGTDPVVRMVNEANTTAGALNVIRSLHDGRTCAEIRMGRNNDNNDFSAAAATTQGDIQFWTTQGGSLSRKATFINSGGLCFGTDTATANALDDYEEGNWTPTLTQTAGVTLTTYGADYTKIGRMVHAYAYVYWSGTPSSPGSQFRIGGLPFTAKSGNTYGNNTILYMDTFDFTGMTPIVLQGNSYVYFHVNAGSSSSANNGHMQPNSSTRYMLFAVSYQT